jgi:hypothetical protein
VIPYQIEGSAWVTIENFGRVGASIPAMRNQWDLASL